MTTRFAPVPDLRRSCRTPRLNTPMVPGPQTSCVIRVSTFTHTLSPGWTCALPEARARTFSVRVISRIASIVRRRAGCKWNHVRREWKEEAVLGYRFLVLRSRRRVAAKAEGLGLRAACRRFAVAAACCPWWSRVSGGNATFSSAAPGDRSAATEVSGGFVTLSGCSPTRGSGRAGVSGGNATFFRCPPVAGSGRVEVSGGIVTFPPPLARWEFPLRPAGKSRAPDPSKA